MRTITIFLFSAALAVGADSKAPAAKNSRSSWWDSKPAAPSVASPAKAESVRAAPAAPPEKAKPPARLLYWEDEIQPPASVSHDKLKLEWEDAFSSGTAQRGEQHQLAAVNSPQNTVRAQAGSPTQQPGIPAEALRIASNQSPVAAPPAAGPIVPPAKPAASITAKPDAAKETAADSSFTKGFKPDLMIRGRFEMPAGQGFAPNTTDSYYLSRMRPSLMIQPKGWLKFFGEGQDAREFGYNAPTQPASMYNPPDPRQAYVAIGGESARNVTLKVGCQEAVIGSGRLIATPAWGNLSRTFDSADLTISGPSIKAELFAFFLVQAYPNRFDRRKTGDEVYGSYFTFNKLIPGGSIKPYDFERRQMKAAGEDGKIGNALPGTFGFRAIGKMPYRFDYSAELAHQWGPFANDHINALSGDYIVGWTVKASARKPRFAGEYSHASGDRANKDGRRQTFDQMFPTNHANSGIAGMVGRRNMREVRGGFEFLATTKLKLQAGVMDFH